MAWWRWVRSASAVGRVGVGEERVIAPHREQRVRVAGVLDPAHHQPGGDAAMASHAQGVGGFGDLGVGDQRAGVGVDDRARIVHRGKRVVVDGLDRRGDPAVSAQGQREFDLFVQAGADHLLGAERGVAAGHDRRVRVDRSGGGDRLLELAGGAAPGAGLAAAQPRLGDHRRRGRRGQRGDQRGQPFAQQRAPGDLGVPERGALFLVPVDRAQQRVDVQKHPLVGARQQRGALPRARSDAREPPRRAGWRARS